MKKILFILCASLLFSITASAYTNLQVNDPRNGGLWANGTIKKATVTITPHGDYMLYEMELELGVGKVSQSKSYDSLEITCNFDLPAGAYVKSAALLIGSEWINADIMPRKEAHAIYEGFVKRRVDPLIVYKNYGDSYLFKIFPISATQTRTMRLSYAMPILSNNGYETAGLLTNLFKASEDAVDVKILLKKSAEFPNPSIGDIVFVDSQHESDYVEATVSSTTITNISSSKKTESIRFSSSTNVKEVTYSLSFKPQDVFNLEDPKKYIFIVDNNPQVMQDSIFTYRYTETGEYVRQFSNIRTINPITNEVLFNELKNMLAATKVGDSCKVYLKNNGVFVSEWIGITPQTIEAVIQTLLANDDSYTANIKELLLSAKSDIEQDNAISFLISNNKQMMYKPFSEIQSEANAIAYEVNLSKSLTVWDITMLNNGTYSYYYFNNRFVSQLSYALNPSERYYYSSQLYSVSDLLYNFNRIQTSKASKILLLNVTIHSNAGVIFDRYTPTVNTTLPNDTYTELGKITEGTKLFADMSLLYKGKRYVASYEFDINNSQNTLVEDAWAVKMVDKLNSLYNAEASAEAEKISTGNAILTQNTAMLAIEPGVEITPCYNCPDWNNMRWEFDNMIMTGEIGFATSYIPYINYENGYYSENYDAGFNDGIIYTEQANETDNTQLYDNGYAAGYADGIFNCKTDDEKSSDIEAYPTEFTTELKVIVFSSKPQTVEVYTANGVFIESYTITKVKELQQSNSLLFGLPSGTYLLKTIIDGKVSYATVFKK